MMREATLVVIEFGASWPKWLEPSGGGDLAVVAQHYEGEPRSLVTQVANRLARLEATGWNLGCTVLVLNERTDPAAYAARSTLARGLLARLARAGGGDLVLTVSDKSPLRARQDMFGLAAALHADAAQSYVRLGVRVGREEPIFEGNWAPPAAPPAE